MPTSNLLNRLDRYQYEVENADLMQIEGKLTRLVGLTLEAVGCNAPIGSRVWIRKTNGEKVEAEVVGFGGDKQYLMSVGNTQGLSPGLRIIPTNNVADVPVGQNLLGRVIDAAGKPLDRLGSLTTDESYPLISKPINPLLRATIREPLDVGVQAVNALLTVGRGQRMGLFSGSGVGKSVLLAMMTRYTSADVIVVGLIGERGREVKEFIEQSLGEEGLKRAVVIASPADQSPLMRLHGAMSATAIAEYFRDQGANVLLLMDSLTRVAQAQREIALAIGEPPVTKGYPPSVFARLPQLVERAGNGEAGKGSITAFYTVLTEGDDPNDPIADAARAILDGHIVLSRNLAEAGHYPAIDLESSISRLMPNVSGENHFGQASLFKRYYNKFQQNSDLIKIGAYAAGSDVELDKAIQHMPTFTSFLQQDLEQQTNFSESLVNLENVVRQINNPGRQ